MSRYITWPLRSTIGKGNRELSTATKREVKIKM